MLRPTEVNSPGAGTAAGYGVRVPTRNAELDELRSRLLYLAARKYGIRRADADDVVQSAFVCYLEIRGRYAEGENHMGILHGIFRNKCREFLNRRRRERAKLRDYAENLPDHGADAIISPGAPAPSAGVDQELMKREDGERIAQALNELRPEARELLLICAGIGRRKLIEILDLNENTLDSRLHVYRRELRKALRRLGIRP